MAVTRSLQGRRVGIVGLGRIGAAIAMSSLRVVPTMIVLDTIKGKCFSFAEGNAAYHNGILDEQKFAQACLELEEIERDCVVRALEKAGGNQTKAASILGISRFALKRKMEKYEL